MRQVLKGSLKKNLAEFVILKGHIRQGDESLVPFPDEYAAKRFLRGFLRSPSGLTHLRNHLLRRGLVVNLSRLDDQEMIREFARHLVSGRIRVVRVDRGHHPMSSGVSEGAAAQPEEKTAEERPPRRPVVFPESRPRNWVKLRIVDDETDEPIPGVVLRVRLPSGETGKPRTDRRGTIYLDDLDPGTLDILEILDDDALEVVGIE